MLALLILIPAAAGHAFEADLSSGGRLSLDCRNTPLRRILKELARQGVSVRIAPGIDINVTAAYEEKPVGQVLDAILKDYNHALIWEKCPDCENAPYTLSEIQIFEPGKKDRLAWLSGYRNFILAKDPDTGQAYVRNEALVRVSGKTGRRALKALVADIGGTIADRSRFGIYRVRLPDRITVGEFLKRLREKGIGEAEPNYAHRLARPRAMIDPRIEPPGIQQDKSSGDNAPIAVFDSGLAPEMRHKPYIQDTFNAIDPRAPIADTQGHGTQMALVAAGAVDPLGTDDKSGRFRPVIPIQGFDENGVTSNYTLMQGLEYAMEKGVRVLSLSWHSRAPSEFLNTCMAEAGKNGMVVIAAAGNRPTGKPVYPAAHPDVVAVGALAPDGDAWDQSNFGDFVDTQAPGFANLPVGYRGPPGIYAGTSISTAYAARQVSAFLEDHPEADAEAVRRFLAPQ